MMICKLLLFLNLSKGISQSSLPYRRTVPTVSDLIAGTWIFLVCCGCYEKQWLKQNSDEIKEQIYKLAKKGLYPSQIGISNSGDGDIVMLQFYPRSDFERFSWSCTSETDHWQQNTSCFKSKRYVSCSCRH